MELDKLKKIIAEILCVDPNELTEQTAFVDDLCADSLDLFQIMMAVEEEFAIEISQEAADHITTVGEAAELIRKSTS